MEDNRNKQIIEALSNKDQVKLKELKVSSEELDSIIKSIDSKIEKIDSEILQYISNVEKQINYTFVIEYKNFLLNNSALKLEKNILGLSNGTENLVEYFYSMDPSNETYILKFQCINSDLKDKLIPFAKLKFKDSLCFERETNRIAVYNYESDTFDIIANNWKEFVDELYDKRVYKTKNGFEYKYKGLKVIIAADEINEELTDYANQIIDFYFNNKEIVNNHLFEKFKSYEWYVNEYSRNDIIDKIGKPTICVSKLNCGEITYLNNELDEHIITIELYGYQLSYVTIDG